VLCTCQRLTTTGAESCRSLALPGSLLRCMLRQLLRMLPPPPTWPKLTAAWWPDAVQAMVVSTLQQDSSSSTSKATVNSCLSYYALCWLAVACFNSQSSGWTEKAVMRALLPAIGFRCAAAAPSSPCQLVECGDGP
jgi:hypothetical protein